jgi:hypothetical protein
MTWHGYVLVEKPAALTMNEWSTVLQALRSVWDKRAESSQPAERLHWRWSLDRSKVLVEAVFDARDLDAEDLGRLCKYVSVALGGKYTPAQVREQLRERVTVFCAGDRWEWSGAAARAHLMVNAADWSAGEPGS